MKKILGYLASIIGVCVLVAIFDFFMHSNKAIEVIFITLLWLLIVVLVSVFVFCIVLLTNKKTKVITKAVILCIVDFFGFCVLGFIYFFAFDLQWGITWQAVTFGLPLLVGMAFLAIDTVFMIQKKSLKRGWWGFGIWIVTLILTIIVLNVFSSTIVGDPRNNPKENIESEENIVLRLVLQDYAKGFSGWGVKYLVISPEYGSFFLDSRDLVEAKQHLLDDILTQDEQHNILQSTNEDTLRALIDEFYTINQQSGNLTIESSIRHGYYIDYDKKFLQYRPYQLIGRVKWYLLHPGAGNYFRISQLAYDHETKLAMLYIESPGSGDDYFYRYENDKVELLDHIHIVTIYD
jgi:hypothetical protein